MARRRSFVPLNVLLNGHLVGVLHRASSGAIDFTYASEWLGWESTFPVSLSLPLREDRYIGAPVIHVFDNLLPDSEAIRRRIAERVGADGTDAYSLLAALGHDCIGALQFLPDGVAPGQAGSTQGDAVSRDEVAAILGNLANAPLGLAGDEDFRISLAGAQEKTALLRKRNRWFKPAGMTATTHILKPQIGRLPNGVDLSHSVENEYLCLKLLAAFGVPAASAEIEMFGNRATLVVERFDRTWTADGRLLRLPQEDICQALSVPPARKYQTEGGPGMTDIIELLKSSDAPDQDIAAFMRACIVFWMLGATDGHAKNFSLALGPGGRFRLTPLYDVISAQPSLDARQIQRNRFRLAMAAGKSRHYSVETIMPRHFLQTAELAAVGAPLVRSVLEDLAVHAVRQAEAVFETLPDGFPRALVRSLRGAVKRRAPMLARAADARGAG